MATMLGLLCLLQFLAWCSAGHAPYFGQDLKEIAESTKMPTNVMRPVTARQYAEFQTYSTRFKELANAYAQGYRAALMAVEAKRSKIPHPPAAIVKKSTIPSAPVPMAPAIQNAPVPNAPIARSNIAGFAYPKPMSLTVRATDKSSIPQPGPSAVEKRSAPLLPEPLQSTSAANQLPLALPQMVQRSTIPSNQPTEVLPQQTSTIVQPQTVFPQESLRSSVPAQPAQLTVTQPQQILAETAHQTDMRSTVPNSPAAAPVVQEPAPVETPKPMDPKEELKRSYIARLNQAARHRNVFFDQSGGDPYSGASGVLSRQSMWLKHRRRRSVDNDMDADLHRHRRSRMPYLGQNLDKLGIVRANVNWSGEKKGNIVQLYHKPALAQTVPAQSEANIVPQNVPAQPVANLMPQYNQNIPQAAQASFIPSPPQNAAAAYRSMVPYWPQFMAFMQQYARNPYPQNYYKPQ